MTLLAASEFLDLLSHVFDIPSLLPDDQLVGGGPLADVAGDGDGLSTGRADFVDHVGGIQRGGDVVDDDRGADPGQAERLSPSQPRGRTGHHRDPSG